MINKISWLKKSVWKSVLVKSIRIGWVAGCEKAAGELSRSDVVSIAHGQIFEDLFPLREDLVGLVEAVADADWLTICRYGTHHGQLGLTGIIMDGVDIEKPDLPKCYKEAADMGVRVSPRVVGCFWRWLNESAGRQPRAGDLTPWTGSIPAAMLDRHVGKWRGDTILTGTTDGHRKLAKIVQREGWGYVRKKVHEKTVENTWSTPSFNLGA